MNKKELVFESIKRNKNILIKLICCIGIIISLTCSFFMFRHFDEERNDKNINRYISSLTYQLDKKNEEVKEIEKYLKNKNLSDESKGKLNMALAEVSYLSNDEIEYNKYVSRALFFLKKANLYSESTKLYNEYAGKLYANGVYNVAETYMNCILEQKGFTRLSNSLKGSIYLTLADIEQKLEKYDLSLNFINNAKIALKNCDSNSSEVLVSKAKCNILLTRLNFLTNNLENAFSLYESLDPNESFSEDKNSLYVQADYHCPYLELTVRYNLAKNNIVQASSNLDEYLSLCEKYSFRNMYLELLRYYNIETDEKNIDNTKYKALYNDKVDCFLNEITSKYSLTLLENTTLYSDTILKIENSESVFENFIGGIIVFLLVFVLFIILLIIRSTYVNMDVLTGLNNRKQFETCRIKLEKSKTKYSFLMIDIDDFKKVNDTYGHAKGDEVLSSTSKIIKKYTNGKIQAYRYGGEEICLIFQNMDLTKAYSVAEKIRQEIALKLYDNSFYVTISGGLTFSQKGENNFIETDFLLYKAKDSGKNMIMIKKDEI